MKWRGCGKHENSESFLIQVTDSEFACMEREKPQKCRVNCDSRCLDRDSNWLLSK